MILHSAGESATLAAPLPNCVRAVVLQVHSENDLLCVERKLRTASVPFILFRETEGPWAGQAMSLGVVPCARTPVLRKILGKLALLR